MRDAGHSVASYFAAFSPAPAWHELVRWPPDAFALANLVLDHSEGYRFAVAPPPGHRFPPSAGWGAEVESAARGWAAAAGSGGGAVPALVSRCFEAVTRLRHEPLAGVRTGEPWELVTSLLTLHAVADEACARLAAAGAGSPAGSFEERARSLLRDTGSLSRVSSARVRVIPKTRFTTNGITIRSLSRYLALCYEAVDARWQPAATGRTRQDDHTILLLPWPLRVDGDAFRPTHSRALANMDTERFGFFEYAPRSDFDYELVESLVAAAAGRAGKVDTVILPEAAVGPEAVAPLERILARHGVGYLIAGVTEPAAHGRAWGRNYLHFGVRTDAGWDRHEQDKHHRWCLDESQIRQYHLTRRLPPRKLWWEAIDIRERALHVIDLGGGVTTTPLVCEDLARLDEVADLVRRMGPTLVVAVLLDGPQLATRWPSRYSSILTDDPGSAVLTLTSYGMVARSRPPGKRRSRVVAHWNERAGGLRQIELPAGAAGVLLHLSVEASTLWTADGRRHRGVPHLVLDSVTALRPRPARR